ncbi:hypothetical protein WOLCODRAFT_96649 [Wolfiporia cocos MD-104 SS10]|uniref:Uncharacterized protein n=1 Tax=Wolfiporia cocos (strain MD-104) TaxID=742152 RepID=A0A2H3J7H8_WOLCO|nr:hypothetical protein WOLCODRAFT_96649 [Wolfiporia cocos MD-104 SS10]
MKRMREEQEQDKARRAREEAARKAEQEAARIRERQEAEKRQKEKAFNKRVQAAASQREAEEKARIQQQRVQSLRSETFAAARRGDAEKVKKNIWENNVDAAGGEYKQSSDFPAGASAVGRQETLMHIAVSLGDLSLVEWLDSHGAEAEERDSEGRTAFHIALQQGRISIIQYFFKMYPHHDDDSAALYNRPESISLLRLAIDSREPGAVWMILENRLATKEDMSETWEYINSAIGKTTLLRTANQHDKGKYDEICNLLICYGGFQLPGGQDSELKEQYEQFTSGPLNNRDMPSISEVTPALQATESQKEPSSSRTHANVPDNDFQHQVKPHRGQNRSRRPYTHYHQPHPTNTFPGTPQSPLNPPGHHDHSFFNGESNLDFTHSPSEGRGRGRGRGRGHGRARGRGHGRGQPSQ